LQNKKKESIFRNLDWPIVLLALGLVLFGFVAIANATLQPLTGDEQSLADIFEKVNWPTLRSQMLFFGIGTAGAVAICCFDIHLFGRFSNALMALAVLLLALVLTQPPINNSRSWFKITETMTFQPSEVGKLALIVALAHRMSRGEKPPSRVIDLLKLLPWLLVPVGLIAIQPDYGSALVYTFTFIGMLFMSGMSIKLFIGFLSSCALTVVPLWFLMPARAQERILVFLNLSSSSASVYQTEHARIAVGSGQFWGKGFFTKGALSQLNYVPEKHNDFIFSVTAEAIGFFGCVLLVAAFALLFWRMLRVASVAQDRYTRLIVSGVVSMMLFHVFENIAMNIGLMPVTGIPLPFISAGGSNLITNLMAIGLVLNAKLRKPPKGVFDLPAP